MAYNSTSWTKDALTKAGGTVTTSGDTSINGSLTCTQLLLSENIIKASDGGSTITLDTNDNVTIAGDLTVSGDLTVTGNQITFGNGEIVNNNVDELFQMKAVGTDDRMLLGLFSGDSGEDSGIIFYEGSAARWSIQQDASDNTDASLLWDFGTIIAGGNTKMDLNSAGSLEIAGDLTISGGNITSALTLDSTLTVTNTTQLNNTLTVGVDDAGHDVKFFGNTASNYMLWDTSADKLIINSTDDNECLQLISTEAETAQGPTIVFERNSASPANDDNLGACVFKGENDADESITYAQLTSSVLSVSDGSEQGNLNMRVQVAGSGRNLVQIEGVGSVGNVTLGYGSASLTKVKGYFAANGATPAAAPNYTISNLSTDRALDCDSTSDAEVADVLGQVITDLIAIGIFQ